MSQPCWRTNRANLLVEANATFVYEIEISSFVILIREREKVEGKHFINIYIHIAQERGAGIKGAEKDEGR